MRVVVALGGNALLRRGESAEVGSQRRNISAAVESLAELARAHEVVITHGNGPQVGLLALQSEAYAAEVPPYPLDVLGAESEGMVGYLIDQELGNRLPGRHVVTLLTQVLVDAADPAFKRPSKPIGPVYSKAEADRLASERGYSVALDGEQWRRVVPSPEPRRIIELGAIRTLVAGGTIVICVGGGGVPVLAGAEGSLHGVEAVIDKDLAAALLAHEVGADILLLLTDVPGIELGWGHSDARLLHATSPREIRGLGLAAGSMGPKAEAAARFAEQGGRAVIADLESAAAAAAGNAGTQVVGKA